MGNSNDVLNTIKDEMVDYIKSSRDPYTSDIAKIVRGAHGVEHAINMPYVGLYIDDDNIHKRILGDNDLWVATVKAYCYMKPESEGVYDKLHQMKDNIVYFLTNDCSYRNYIDVYGCPPIESSLVKVDYIEIYFTVIYEYSPI